MNRLRSIWDIFMANFRVIFLKDREIITDEAGGLAFKYLWTYIPIGAAFNFLEYTKKGDAEQFAPFTILRYIDLVKDDVIYVAPFTITKDGGILTFAITIWAVGTASLSLGWTRMPGAEEEG